MYLRHDGGAFTDRAAVVLYRTERASPTAKTPDTLDSSKAGRCCAAEPAA
jgi:hypothetical protein